MRRLVNESLPEPSVRLQAARIVQGLTVSDPAGQLYALRGWLGRVWRFRRDPHGVELVHRPERLLDQFSSWGYVLGDCDDAAVLGAALGKALGFTSRFVVLGFFGPRMPFSHVYTEVRGPRGWVDLDVTRPPGWQLPATRWKAVSV